MRVIGCRYSTPYSWTVCKIFEVGYEAMKLLHLLYYIMDYFGTLEILGVFIELFLTMSLGFPLLVLLCFVLSWPLLYLIIYVL